MVGPRLMEDRKPFELRRVLIVYNFLQVIFSAWLFYEASSTGWFAGYSLRCQPVDYSRTPTALRVSNYIYIAFSFCYLMCVALSVAIFSTILHICFIYIHRWPKVAGGTIFPNSLNSLIPYSL